MNPCLSLLAPPTLDSIDKTVTMVLETLIPTFARMDDVKKALANRWLNQAITFHVAPPLSSECPCGIKRETCDYHRQ